MSRREIMASAFAIGLLIAALFAFAYVATRPIPDNWTQPLDALVM